MQTGEKTRPESKHVKGRISTKRGWESTGFGPFWWWPRNWREKIMSCGKSTMKSAMLKKPSQSQNPAARTVAKHSDMVMDRKLGVLRPHKKKIGVNWI